MGKNKQFKAESKRLLDLMINSIYTHKEIFLRELISNASDAIDKLNYLSLNEEGINRDNLKIEISVDENNKTITIRDNGIGMNEKELEENLGTIAKSGSLAFKQQLEENQKDDVDIIGQFGVGFYASFMVAKEVIVESKKYNEDKAYRWSSDGVNGFSIEECEKLDRGTSITLFLKDDTEEENYSEFASQYKIETLVKKYSDYIRYPITMMVSHYESENEDENGEEDKPENKKLVVEEKTLNSMVPLWKRNKSEIKDEDYNEFYKNKFNDYVDPQKVIHTHVEGALTFDALLFIPSHAPYNYYSQDYEKGLQLYSSGVFIMDKASELIPEHFRFVRGLVDSQDLSLNISREMLQHDRQLKVMSNRIEKKIQSELKKMLMNEREEYEKFWANFGLQLKYGIYNDFGAHKELLQDLLLFTSSKEMKLVTLKEYVDNMKEGQDVIYFASGDDVNKIDKLPAAELVKDKGYEILYLTDNVDEFALQVLQEYDSKKFKNITQGDLNLESEEEKKQVEEKKEENKDLLEALKENLKDKVSDVKLSTRLKSHPVCLSADEGLSFEMERVLAQMPEGNPYGMKATRILEINPNHAIFTALQNVYAKDKDKISKYADLLYDQAMLIEGFDLEDPIAFSNLVCELMIDASK
ncbi:MAG: molecular chaperone HtpG [Traorella sp.]